MKSPLRPEVARQALTNAGCIGYLVGHSGETLLVTVDAIVEAATALAQVECSPGFDWELQNKCWDDVCHILARRIHDGPVPDGYDWFAVLVNECQLYVVTG